MADDEREPDTPNPDTQVRDWRVLQALEVGLTVEQAEKFAAGDGNLARLRDLVKKGWKPSDAVRVV